MTAVNMDRSLAFTALLEHDPEGFGKQDMETSGKTITEFLGDYKTSRVPNMYEYAKGWTRDRQQREDARAAEKRASEEHERDLIASMDPDSYPPGYFTPGNVLAAQRESADSWAWQAEPDPGPTERQMEDWNIHNDHADGLEPDYEREDMELGE